MSYLNFWKGKQRHIELGFASAKGNLLCPLLKCINVQ